MAPSGLEVPFWCVPWAGGQALARWVLDHPASVRGKRVVDFGTGSGLVAIACARATASSVRAIDVDPLAEAACLLNAEANDVAFEVLCADVVDTALDTDVLLASPGVRVLTGDPCRAYVPGHLHELARYDVPTCADLESTTVRVTRVLELRSS